MSYLAVYPDIIKQVFKNTARDSCRKANLDDKKKYAAVTKAIKI